MQHVLRCDYEACRQYLVNLEQAFLLDQGSQALGALLGHRCDGNRNILHAAVSVCFPVSNKETKEEEGWCQIWMSVTYALCVCLIIGLFLYFLKKGKLWKRLTCNTIFMPKICPCVLIACFLLTSLSGK